MQVIGKRPIIMIALLSVKAYDKFIVKEFEIEKIIVKNAECFLLNTWWKTLSN